MPETVGGKYRFECGCEFQILEPPTSEGVVPLIDIDTENLPLNCSATWRMISEGKTRGVFQLEKQLGQEWSRKLKPESLEHLCALGALLRPGAMNARDEEGVSSTEHYCLRKNGLEEWDDMHPALRKILAATYGTVAFQESFLRIARELADFDLAAVYRLQKGVSKKSYTILAELKKEFLEGCVRAGVLAPDVAEMVWSWIEAAGRYAFCRAHAMTYAMLGYETAYLKCHFPVQFYTACLRVGCDDMDDVRTLVNDAREFGVDVRGPHFMHDDIHCHTDGLAVYYGVCDVKGVGESAGRAFLDVNQAVPNDLGKPLGELTWFEYLMYVVGRIEKPILYIRSGALDRFGLTRARMVAELDCWKTLTDAEREWVLVAHRLRTHPDDADDVRHNLANLEGRLKELKAAKDEANADEVSDLKESIRLDGLRLRLLEHGFAPFDSLETALDSLGLPRQPPKPKTKAEARKPQPTGPFGGCNGEARRDIVLSMAAQLRNPPVPYADSPRQIAMEEEELLGLPISIYKLDQCDLSEANTTVQKVKAGDGKGDWKKLLLGVEVVEVRPTVTRKGQNPGQEMARLSLADRTGSIEAVAFPEVWARVRGMVQPGALLLLQVQRDKKNDLSVIVQDVWRPKRGE